MVAAAVAGAAMKEEIVADVSKQSRNSGTLKITLVRSAIGYSHDQKATVKALGLHRLHQTVEHPDNPQVRGQVFKIRHLLRVEES